MSRRKLNRDPAQMRQRAYEDLNQNTNELEEALWEALAHLHAQGIDLGPKATRVVMKRHQIKTRFPK